MLYVCIGLKMTVFFQIGKFCMLRKSLKPSFFNLLVIRGYADSVRKWKSFNDEIVRRREEAQRSLVVQVNSESSFNELYGYCSKYASVKDIHHYRNFEKEHFMLIEFETEDNVQEVLKACSSHQKDMDVMAIQSPFLWFKAINNKEKHVEPISKQLATKDGIKIVGDDTLFEELLNCESVSDQIQLLYDRTKLNDLGVRLRFMVARQLEVIFKSLYANVAVHPFGSSVNGFGKMGCDLDLVLTNVLTEEMSLAQRRLIFQEKRSEGGLRSSARQLELVGALLELRVPGAASVRRVLAARVPILKCTHDFAALHCDLCCTNTSGLYMSELLWLYGSLDSRVRPLTFAVRRWAKAVGLTNQHPGRWITNFPLTLMVLFFLQQKRKTGFILPSMKLLVSKSGKEDIRIAEENINCTFLRDPNKLSPACYSQCDDDLGTLLFQFFEFYAQFDFQEKAISINEGVPIRKPNALPLYIVNPLENALNVSRNVSYEECERLRLEVRNAAWQLEAGLEGKQGKDWGILNLIEPKDSKGLKQLLRVGNSHRLVSMKDLFKDDDDIPISRKKKSTSDIEKSVKQMRESLVNGEEKEQKTEQRMKFKNSQVASEVFRIRRNKIL